MDELRQQFRDGNRVVQARRRRDSWAIETGTQPFSDLNELGRVQFDRLWRAVQGTPPPELALRAFDALVPPGTIANTWRSFVSDDHTPYEFSLLLGGSSPEVRVMSEALGVPGSGLRGTIDAALGMRRTLEGLGADFTRFDAIADLFLPAEPQGSFALWYAASFGAHGVPAWKVYFNPAVQGRNRAASLVEEALVRLGFPDAWATVTRAMPRGPMMDDLRFLSIDLSRHEGARVKVYGFHYDVDVDYLCDIASHARNADRNRVQAFCNELVGANGVLRASRQPATCLAFADGDATPRTATVHFPIRAFEGDDAGAHQRTLRACASLGIDPAPYEAALAAFSPRSLDGGSGLVAWVAARTGGSPKMTVYLAPKALHDDAAHAGSKAEPSPESPEAVVRHYEDNPATDHPLFVRMAREPLDLSKLTLLILNIREAITRDFARRLSSVVARVDEDAIRSVLAKQLDDELGHGEPERAHKALFETFVGGLSQWWPPADRPEALEPGRVFGAVLEELYTRRSPYEGLGATLIMECYGKQGDLAMGALFRSAKEPLPERVLEWLSLHEALEVDHVDESFELARMVPAGSKAKLAARGAAELGAAGWAFLDGVYRVCYGER
ncbi:MAG: hypothetical protein HOW73_08595 [Polyangiaceae bacterium]|nr:hypothetical protein [Polyangiaceae bacterium]